MSRNDPGGNGRESEFTSWTEKLRNSEKWPTDLIAPEGGVSKQKVEETKSVLRELGLNDDVSQK